MRFERMYNGRGKMEDGFARFRADGYIDHG
jgi:hypothetical protein